ncbi:MAG TPA: permease [Leptolyngbyaceae cyanobacterium M33_DOE_097]|uniref:Permease n=1 Tax=Oscillatoriales cyanobacterium SpSt-418 TaxID=2282169 RepID=A0A7C3KI44_9CYAN|nr:permease [Leptolyngbyaceae cyanobacterium M33_DOE_097]
MVSVSHQANHYIQKDAMLSGVINAVINGVIGWFMFRGKDVLPLTVDTISAHEKTVFSTGVMTAFLLSVILGIIAFFNFGKKAKSLQLASPDLLNRPFFFFGVRTVLFYSLFAFGTAALVALFLQKFAGPILVTPVVGGILLGLIAGIAAWFINAAVMKAMLRPE